MSESLDEQLADRARGPEAAGRAHGGDRTDARDFLGRTVENLFAEVWSRDVLSMRDRRLLLLGLLVGQGLDDMVAGQLDVRSALQLGLLTVIFTFTFVNMFDTAGTLVGLGTKMGVIDEKTGTFPRVGRVLVSDALATMIGAVLGTSTVTTYVESAAGIGQGGRTGLTAVVTGLLFLLAVFFWPLAGVIPAAATAPALIIVGLLMMEPIRRLNLDDITEDFVRQIERLLDKSAALNQNRPGLR